MKHRIIITSLIIAIISLLVYVLISVSSFYNSLKESTLQLLQNFSALYSSEDYPSLDENDAISFASKTGLLCTFITLDGIVTGDSSGTEVGTDISQYEEVAGAIENGSAFAIRKENEETILWYCLITDGIAIRIGTPIKTIGDLFVESLPTVGWFLLVEIIFSVIIAYLCSAWILRPIEKLVEQSNTQTKIASEYTELTPVANALNRKSVALNEQLEVIKTERAHIQSIKESKNEFIANITHEMNTPLTSIKGFAELLGSGNLNEKERANAVRIIMEQADRLSGLIECIINYNELNNDELPSYECNVGEIARDVAEALRPAIENSGIALILDIDNNAVIPSRQERLTEIFGNLIRNAARYNKENGSVTVRVRCGLTPFAEVEDTGIGIAEENLDKIFSRFFTVDKSHSGKHGGFGLGLAVVKKLCDRAGWRLTVKSVLGSGTTFKIEF